MTFILSAQRHRDLNSAFSNYKKYLEQQKEKFPPSAYALATSGWYFDFNDPRCPHDAWIKELLVSEKEAPSGRAVEIKMTLLNAYHDRELVFYYPGVSHYEMALFPTSKTHQDWRYDELRLSDNGQVIHEIEWFGPSQTGRFIIQATEVHFEEKKLY